MTAYRLARREPHSNVIAALRLLTRVLPLPASRASPKAPTVGALTLLYGSESANIRWKEYYIFDQFGLQVLWCKQLAQSQSKP